MIYHPIMTRSYKNSYIFLRVIPFRHMFSGVVDPSSLVVVSVSILVVFKDISVMIVTTPWNQAEDIYNNYQESNTWKQSNFLLGLHTNIPKPTHFFTSPKRCISRLCSHDMIYVNGFCACFGFMSLVRMSQIFH